MVVNDFYIAAQTSILEFIQILETILCLYINNDSVFRVLSIEFLRKSLHVGLEIVPNISVSIIPIDIADARNGERLSIVLIYCLFL